MKKPQKKPHANPSGYLVVTFENFPGVAMPLLSEEECKARGVKPGKLPPLDTWTPTQQAAIAELAEVLAQVAVKEVLESEQTEELS